MDDESANCQKKLNLLVVHDMALSLHKARAVYIICCKGGYFHKDAVRLLLVMISYIGTLQDLTRSLWSLQHP